MNIRALNSNDLLYWVTATLLLMSFGFADLAVVAWSASLFTIGQLAAAAVAFVLIGTGVFVTAWWFGRRHPDRQL